MLRDLGREGTRVHVTGVADRARRDLATARWWAFLWSKLGFGKKQCKAQTLLLELECCGISPFRVCNFIVSAVLPNAIVACSTNTQLLAPHAYSLAEECHARLSFKRRPGRRLEREGPQT